jgi:microcystin-dependent protein
MAQYLTLLTNIGAAKLATALANGSTVRLSQMAVGDGNGASVTPSATQSALVREKHRVALQSVTVDPANPNYIIAEAVIPSTVGGWTIREAGLFDSTGQLFAVANFPDTVKPLLAEGSARDLVVRVVIQVSNASAVQLLIDPSVVLASQAWVLAQAYVKKSGDTMTGGLTAPTIHITNPNGDSNLEIGGSGPVYIDLKKPDSEDSDLRIATDGTVGGIECQGQFYVNAASSQGISLAKGGGSVGIGTDSSLARLAVVGKSDPDNNPELRITATGGNSNLVGIDVHAAIGAGGYNPLASLGDKAIFFSNEAKETGNLLIAPWSDQPKGIKIIGSTGNVGVGVSSPTAKLDVGGNVRCSDPTEATHAATKQYVDAARGVDSVPIGEVIWHAGSTAPASFLVCDGSAVSRTTYDVLFARIGTTYGAGDGSTTFNLPDLRGEFIRGWDSRATGGADNGRVFGSKQSATGLGHIGTDASSNQLAMSVDQVENNTYEGYSYPGRLDSGQAGTATQKRWRVRPRNVAMLPCIKARLLTSVDLALMQQAQSMYLPLSGGALTGELYLPTLRVGGWITAPEVHILNTSGDSHLEIGGSGNVYIDLKKPDSEDFDARFSTDGTNTSIETIGPFYLNSNSNQKVVLAAGGGNVGIGTVNPSEKLEVVGNIKCSDPTAGSHAATKQYVDAATSVAQVKAWVNFNGTGTVAIRGSYNVSSITDNGVGDYTVNFASGLADANYCVGGTCTSANVANWAALSIKGGTTPTSSAVNIRTASSAFGAPDSSGSSDATFVTVSIIS